VRGQPALEALRVGHAAVQRDHGLGTEAGGEAFFELGREVDLGHQHQGLGFRVGVQHFLHAAQVDLGLAAAGAAEQHERAFFGGDLRARAFLLGRQGHCGQGLASVASRRGRAAQAPGQLFRAQVAQLRWQGGQRHLAQRSLVIACSEPHQPAPGRIERRHTGQHPGDGAHGRAFGQLAGGFFRVPDHAQHLAGAKGHPHQRPGGQGLGAGVAQQVAHAAVRGSMQGHMDDGGGWKRQGRWFRGNRESYATLPGGLRVLLHVQWRFHR